MQEPAVQWSRRRRGGRAREREYHGGRGVPCRNQPRGFPTPPVGNPSPLKPARKSCKAPWTSRNTHPCRNRRSWPRRSLQEPGTRPRTALKRRCCRSDPFNHPPHAPHPPRYMPPANLQYLQDLQQPQVEPPERPCRKPPTLQEHNLQDHQDRADGQGRDGLPYGLRRTCKEPGNAGGGRTGGGLAELRLAARKGELAASEQGGRGREGVRLRRRPTAEGGPYGLAGGGAELGERQAEEGRTAHRGRAKGEGQEERGAGSRTAPPYRRAGRRPAGRSRTATPSTQEDGRGRASGWRTGRR